VSSATHAVGEDAEPPGVRKNARLTSLTGFVLLLLLFAEGVTVLRVGALVVPHIAIGAALLAPVALKLSTTGWKIVRYYTHAPDYVRAGPPPMARRLLAPVVMVTTVGLLATGIGLMLIGPGSTGRLSFLHKAFFALWFLAMAVHVLVHVARSLRSVVAEYLASNPDALPGRGVRALTIAGTLLVGVGLAVWATGFTAQWTAVFHR
jgi:succinate dehydrogenase hydrophobic anchor subunit